MRLSARQRSALEREGSAAVSGGTQRREARADREERSFTAMRNSAPTDARELEALETREWLESLDYVLQHGGPARVGRLLRELGVHATKRGVKLPFTANT